MSCKTLGVTTSQRTNSQILRRFFVNSCNPPTATSRSTESTACFSKQSIKWLSKLSPTDQQSLHWKRRFSYYWWESLSLSVTKIGTWTASLCNCEKMWTACSHCPPEQLGNDGLKCRVNKYVNQYEPLGESCAWSTWLLMRIIKRSLVHPRTHHHNHRHRCHHRRWFQRPYSSPRTRTHSMAPFSQALIAAQKVTTVARSLWRFKSWERLTCRPWGEGQFGWKWWAMIDEKDWFASVFGRQTALQKQRCHDRSDSNTLWGPVMETLLKTVSRKHPPEKKGPNKGFVLLVHGSYIE